MSQGSYIYNNSWKQELSQNGYILCEKMTCKMGFLSVKGMEVHFQTCTGEVKEGDFVACPVCEVRFKTFLIMERHKLKTHKSVIESRKDLTKPLLTRTPVDPSTYEKTSIDLVPQSQQSSVSPSVQIMEVSNVFEADMNDTSDGLHSNESKEEQSRRLLVESRMLYSGRRPGRPPKANSQKYGAKPPMVCRSYDSSTDDESALSSISLMASSVTSSPSNTSLVGLEKALKDKERELKSKEAQLQNYHEQVIKVEKLAEDATRIALEEKELKLRKLAEELKAREAMAKQKLANAMQSMEMMKSTASSQELSGDDTLISTPGQPTTSSLTVPEGSPERARKSSSSQSTPNPVIAEEEEIALTNESFILPHSQESSSDQPAAGSSRDNVLVLNDNEQLQILLAKAQRGEVTLVAQPCGDGNYILQESSTSSQIKEHHESESVAKISHDAIDATKEVVTEEITDQIANVESEIMTTDIAAQESEKEVIDEPDVTSKVMLVERKEAHEIIEDIPNIASKSVEIEAPSSPMTCQKPKRTRRSVSRKAQKYEELGESSKPVHEAVEPETHKKNVTSEVQDEDHTPSEVVQDKLPPMPEESKFQTAANNSKDVSMAVDEQKSNQSSGKSKRNANIPVRAGSRRSQKLIASAIETKEPEMMIKDSPPPKRTPKARKNVRQQETPTDEILAEDVPMEQSKNEPVKSPDVEVPPPKSKRTRGKRKRSEESQEDTTAKEETNKVVEKAPPTKKPRRSNGKSKEDAKICCNVCDQSFKNEKQFNVHRVKDHYGIARVKGDEGSDPTDEEILVIIRDAFRMFKPISIRCYKCKEKSFGTFPGMKYHWQTCSKTEEELDSMLEKCPYFEKCGYKNIHQLTKQHATTCKFGYEYHANRSRTKEEDDNEDESDYMNVSQSGRRIRGAAKRASKIMANAMDTGTEKNMLDRNDDSDDEYKIPAKDMYKTCKDGTFSCHKCVFNTSSKADMEKHCLEDHVEEPEDEDMDEGDEEVEPPSGSEDDDEVTDVVEAFTPSRRRGGHFKGRWEEPGSASKFIHYGARDEELQFRRQNFHKNAFEQFKVKTPEPVSNALAYLPKSSQSVIFNFKDQQDQQYDFHEAKRHGAHRLSFYAGGPVWSSAWCPQPLSKSQEILALCADLTFDQVDNASDEGETNKCLIQFWMFNNHDSVEYHSGLGLDVKVNSIKWCPSVGKAKEDARIGLLAVACSDGAIRILTLSKAFFDKPSTAQVVTLEPSMVLRKSNDNYVPCLNIDWFRGSGHRMIAATYEDGMISMFDIMTKSPLLNTADGLYPLKTFHAHPVFSKPTLALSQRGSWPNYLISGSRDRKIIVWNIHNLCEPEVVEEHEGLAVTDLKWITNSERHFAAGFDDAYTMVNTRALVFEIGTKQGQRHHSLLNANSTIWSIDHTPFFNVFTSATTTGECTLFFGPETLQTLFGSHFKSSDRRTLLYKSKLEIEDHADSLARTFNELTEKYRDLKVRIVDSDLKRLMNISKETLAILKDKDGPAFEDVRKYPLISINRAQFSPNDQSRSWLFTGSQSGLCRLIQLPDFKK